MKLYVVAGRSVEIGGGEVVLSAEQAKHRRHSLSPLDGDIYAVTGIIQLKRGEVFGWDGEFGKVLGSNVEEIGGFGPVVADESDSAGDADPTPKAKKQGRQR